MAERRRTRTVRYAEDDPDQRPPEAEADVEADVEADEGSADQDEARPGQGAAGEDDEAAGEDDEAAAEAEPAPSRSRKPGTNGRAGGKRRPPSRRHAALTVTEAAKAALQQIMELTARPAESITGVERTEDGWKIGIEVVEDRRIPSSSDILATYRAEIDEDGELVSYHRVRRYPRGRGDSSEGS